MQFNMMITLAAICCFGLVYAMEKRGGARYSPDLALFEEKKGGARFWGPNDEKRGGARFIPQYSDYYVDKRGGARFITGSDKKAGARFLDDSDDGADAASRRFNSLRRLRDYLKKRGGARYILADGAANENFREKRGGARFVPDSWINDVVRKRPGARRYYFSDRSPYYFLMDKRPGARYAFFDDDLY